MLRTAALLLALAPLTAAQDALLKLGDAFTGSIDSAFDSDTVRFECVAGTLLTTSAKGAKGFHPALTLTDLTSGLPVDLTDHVFGAGGAKTSIKKLPLPTTGEYELSVGPADDTLGGYKLTTKGVVPKPLKVFKDGTASEPGTGEVHFAAGPGTKLTAVVKPVKGSDVVPGVPVLTGPDGDVDLFDFVDLTTGKVPTAKVTGLVLATLGDYTFTAVAQADGEAPPLVTTLKLVFPKNKKTIHVESAVFKNIDTVQVSVSTDEAPAIAGSLDAATTLDGKRIVFLSYATNLVPGCGGGVPPGPVLYDVFVRDLDATTTVSASAPSGSADGLGGCESPAIDSLGTVVAFGSSAAGLVAGDGNGKKDVFVRDLGTLVTTRVSVISGGAEAHGGDSTDPSLSGDGRFVAFASGATDLVANDGNGTQDIFLHDRQGGTTVRISVTSAGTEIHGDCSQPVFSRDGTHVAFITTAADLLAGDGNGKKDIYVKVLATGAVLRATLNAAGGELNVDVDGPALSGDGRFVAFSSTGAFGGGGGITHVFVKDMVTGAVDLVSTGENGPANNHSVLPRISANGQLVLFRSLAGNLVAGGDPNGPANGDVYLRDRGAGTTIKVSVSSLSAEPGNGDCYSGDLSGDGSHAVFFGGATNLVPQADLNGAWDVWVRF
jgi:Tol biopolymer transport system component